MSRESFISPILVAVLALVIAVGGVGTALAWKTDYLDRWLPPNIKEMLGRGEKPEEEPEEKPEEKPESVNKIAFIRNGDIWVISPDGGEEEQITKEGNITDLVWYKTAEKIAYLTSKEVTKSNSEKETIGWSIKSINLQNKKEETLIAPPQDGSSVWSDSKVALNNIGGVDLFSSKNLLTYTRGGLHLKNLITNEDELLAESVYQFGEASFRLTKPAYAAVPGKIKLYSEVQFSPQGNYILASIGHYESSSYELWPVDGGNPLKAGSGGIGWAKEPTSFLAENILLGISYSAGYKADNNALVRITPGADKAATTVIYEIQGFKGGTALVGKQLYSSDKEMYLASSRSDLGSPSVEHSETRIYSITADTKKVVDLTKGQHKGYRQYLYEISPDDTKALYVVSKAASWEFIEGELWLINLETSKLKKLAGGASQPAWSPK